MAAITPGFFLSNFFPDTFWIADFWTEYRLRITDPLDGELITGTIAMDTLTGTIAMDTLTGTIP